jgi:transcriptional regulator with XRE-family HTH domain
MNQIGEKIRELRKIAKDTQQELADKLDISAKQLHRYEKGEVVPNPGILAMIGKIYKYNFSATSDDQSNTGFDHTRIDHLLKTNSELVKMLSDRLPADQQQTNVEIAATIIVLRSWLLNLYSTKPVRYATPEDAAAAFRKEVKQVMMKLHVPDNKDTILR